MGLSVNGLAQHGFQVRLNKHPAWLPTECIGRWCRVKALDDLALQAHIVCARMGCAGRGHFIRNTEFLQYSQNLLVSRDRTGLVVNGGLLIDDQDAVASLAHQISQCCSRRAIA